MLEMEQSLEMKRECWLVHNLKKEYMKKVLLFCLLSLLCFGSQAQVVATRIRDLVTETSLYTDTYFVVDRSGYTTLKKISVANMKTYFATYFAPKDSPVFTGDRKSTRLNSSHA